MEVIRARAIPLRELGPADRQAWQDLAERAVEPNPFCEPGFLGPACRHLRNGKHAVLLVAEDERGRFHACLPLRRAGTGLAPVRTAWRHLYGYLQTPLVGPEQPVEALGCLLAALTGRGRWSRVTVLELIGDDGPVGADLRRAADRLGLAVAAVTVGERAVLGDREDSEGREDNGDREDTRGHADSGGRDRDGRQKDDQRLAKVRRERRAKARQWRRLCAEQGNPAVTDRSADPEATEDFLALEASGWKGQARTALASRAGDAAFYREVTAGFRAAGRLRVHALERAGQNLAMQTSLAAGPVVFDWKAAYDERFARYSPGAQLQLRVADLAEQDGIRWIDSCADTGDEHQQRLCAGRRRIATLAFTRRGPVALPAMRLAVRLVEASGTLRGLSARTLRYRLTGRAARR